MLQICALYFGEKLCRCCFDGYFIAVSFVSFCAQVLLLNFSDFFSTDLQFKDNIKLCCLIERDLMSMA